MVSELFRSGFFNFKGHKKMNLHQKMRREKKKKVFTSSGFMVKEGRKNPLGF